MCIGKSHTVFRERVQIWRWDFAVWIEGFEIAITHIVRKNEDNVRLLSGRQA